MIKKKATTKRKPRKKSAADTVDFQLFLKAIVEAYPNGKLSAGISCAWLPEKQKWYVSICRYDGLHKVVVMAEHSSHSIQDAIVQLADKWKASMRPKTHNNLENFLK